MDMIGTDCSIVLVNKSLEGHARSQSVNISDKCVTGPYH